MLIRDIIYGIEDLFVNYLFFPFDFLRITELDNWWIANFMTWVSIVVFICAFTYWMLQLKKFDDNKKKTNLSLHILFYKSKPKSFL